MDKFVVIGVIILVIFLTILLGVGGVQRYQWLDEHCEVIGKMSGSTSIGVGFGSSGGSSVMPIFSPGKTHYKCDDGLEYWE